MSYDKSYAYDYYFIADGYFLSVQTSTVKEVFFFHFEPSTQTLQSVLANSAIICHLAFSRSPSFVVVFRLLLISFMCNKIVTLCLYIRVWFSYFVYFGYYYYNYYYYKKKFYIIIKE